MSINRFYALLCKTFLLPAFFFGVLWSEVASAQTNIRDSVFVHIDSIKLEGNHKTNSRLILRELEFKAGDSIPLSALSASFERNSQRVMNLNLFTAASINIIRWKKGNHLVLRINLTETWYVFPIPVFALADRNFNVWWTEFHRSLRRVNYGIDLSHNNLTGLADVLKAHVEFGYHNTYSISYRLPPLNRDQTIRLQTGISFSRQHEITFNTIGDKVLFRKDPNIWLLTQLYSYVNLNWRPGLHTSQSFTLEYRDTRVADSISILNPDYFLSGQSRQHHFSLVYNLRSDHRDIQPYPLNGWLGALEIRQNGLLPSDNLHLFRFFGEFHWYQPLVKNLFLETKFKGRFSLPRKKPPYYNNQALGYSGNFVRGYELYVTDGLDFGLIQTSFHYEIFNRTFELGRYMPFKAFKTLPLKLYLTFNNDVGYSNEPFYAFDNPQTNRALYGYGVGLDIVAWYNKTFRFEYSRNDLGQGGLFVRIDSGF
jgi:outer membrane protein assembly factor BamA